MKEKLNQLTIFLFAKSRVLNVIEEKKSLNLTKQYENVAKTER